LLGLTVGLTVGLTKQRKIKAIEIHKYYSIQVNNILYILIYLYKKQVKRAIIAKKNTDIYLYISVF
jgi:hypothetical protein